MTRTLFGKILAVVVTVISVAYMGFAMATVYGGPNWLLMAKDPEFRGYKIVYRGGENPQWIATRASDEQQVASSALLPQVIVKVMDDIQQVRGAKISAMKEQEPRLRDKLQQYRVTAEKDEPALQAKIDFMKQELAKVRDESNRTAVSVLAATAEAQKLENQISLRREDVLRLEREVVELQADHERLGQVRKQLEDLLMQVEGNLDRARERQQELDVKLQNK